MWQYILTILSTILFFGFVIWGVIKYGLLSCYSAYAPKWGEFYKKINIWSFITAFSAILMIPVLLEVSDGSYWQFLGFLAPTSLFLVSISPNYATDKFQWWIHQIGAISAAIFIIFYITLIPKLWIIIVLFLIIAICFSFWKKKAWLFWIEMAIYLMTYIVLFKIITLV